MKINSEIKIGLMVAVSILILVYMTFKTGDLQLSNKGYYIKIQFHNIDGINLNSPVMFNGLEVGSVEDIILFDDQASNKTKIELLVKIDEKARLRSGAKAYVKNLGLMGAKYVGLMSGAAGESYLGEGSVIVGEEPQDFSQLVEDGREIAKELKDITKNINERLDKNRENIDGVLTNANQTLANLAAVSDRLDNLLGGNQMKIDKMISHFEYTSTNLEEMSYDLKQNPWKLLYRSKEEKK